ncbi:MAG: AI-2E family transporter [Actinomycetota bacterium]|nr:AI-2E family transporter [Actinomycetota bacterium]
MNCPPLLDRAAQLTWRSLVVAGGVALSVVALAHLRILVLPVIIALLVSSVLVPPVRRLQRSGVPRALATWMLLLGSLGALIGVVVLAAPSVAEEFADLGPTVSAGVEQVKSWLVDGPLELSDEQINRYSDQVFEQLRSSGSRIASGVLAGAILAGEVVAGLLLTLVLVFFFVKDGEKICAFALDQIRPRHQDLAKALGRRVWEAIGGYVKGTALVALADAAIIGVGLLLIGVPLVLPLTLLVFFGAFFPLVGAVLAGTVAVLVALVSGGPGDALLTLGVVVVVQQVEGDVLAPLVLGRAVRLHPLVILMALTGGAVIGGLIGAFLAVPIAAVAVAVASELKAREIIGPASPPAAPPPPEVTVDGGPQAEYETRHRADLERPPQPVPAAGGWRKLFGRRVGP